MKCSDPSNIDSTVQNRLIKWQYYFPTDEKDIPICKQFLCNVLNVGFTRLRTVQNKILNNEDLNDERGKHGNQQEKLTDDMKELILIHCQSMPHRESHYKRETTALNYFSNPELNLQIMFDLFCDFYKSVTQEVEEIPQNKNFNFGD